ncbi:hypothetical protein L914_21484, partial [Phytophthora nicotianae]
QLTSTSRSCSVIAGSEKFHSPNIIVLHALGGVH